MIVKWEKFLRPDWKKIVLMILIPYFIRVLYVIFSLSKGTHVIYTSSFIATNNMPLLILVNEFLGSILISWIWSYPLSCLIVWIYDKRKKK